MGLTWAVLVRDWACDRSLNKANGPQGEQFSFNFVKKAVPIKFLAGERR